MFWRRLWCTSLGVLAMLSSVDAYPVDGYATTGIRRLELLRLRVEDKLPGNKPVSGALRSTAAIRLHLLEAADVVAFPDPDRALQKRLDALFPRLDESYAMALLDITPGRAMRFVSRQGERRFAPGSVGKLGIAVGIFAALQALYPESPSARQELLRTRMVVADKWIRTDSHSVPIYDPADQSSGSRPIQEGDVFSLYEWVDHMLSASANAAASVVWKEAMLMHAFGQAYPPSREQEAAYFATTKPGVLRQVAMSTVNEPLRRAGIGEHEWQQGTLFTRAAQHIVPGAPSYATPLGLLRFLFRLEQGRIVDQWSSLELKRLMYMTARRIRYASSPALTTSAVYFKSGSLFRCQPEPEFTCRKYMGNVENVMNSVAIVETPQGRIYLVALMSNVLRKNSAVDHQRLATEIERLLAQ